MSSPSHTNLRAGHSTFLSNSTVDSSSGSYPSNQASRASSPLSNTTIQPQHNTALASTSGRASPFIPLTGQSITQNDNQTGLHSNPQYISNSQTHYAPQISTSIASFNINAHLTPNLLAKVVYNQETMTPMERFKDPSVFPYQQYSAYQPLPDSLYHSTPRYKTPPPYHYLNETSSAQVSPGYSVQIDDRVPAYYEYYGQSLTTTDVSVGEGGLVGVGTQFEQARYTKTSICSKEASRRCLKISKNE